MACVFKEYVQIPNIPSFYGMEFPSDAEMRNAHVVDASGNLDYPFKSAETIDDSTKYIYGDEYNEIYFVVNSDGIFKDSSGEAIGSLFINLCYEPIYMEGCKEKKGITINPTSSEKSYRGVSEDEKPTNVPKYSIYWELDTGKFYYFDGESWNEIPMGNTPVASSLVGEAIVGESLVG